MHAESSQEWKCQCGLPGVRLSTNPGTSNSRAYYKCVPCNRFLGFCPCTTPGDRTTSTCPCNERRGSSSSLDEVPRGMAMFSSEKSGFNPHNPEPGFDVDWEANCSPGFMVARFKALGPNDCY
ncbi:hypothetical protein N7456_000931 [Penicillium angulare]|uniref:GRF-like zinc ribbon domain-containing protein n=1 Tax=Penicillium angulare TaxID=116970 RepID=A0A9W9KSC8_9EURO|nr:hypothetical protein N7456_000931 [Penicillium angulare]